METPARSGSTFNKENDRIKTWRKSYTVHIWLAALVVAALAQISFCADEPVYQRRTSLVRPSSAEASIYPRRPSLVRPSSAEESIYPRRPSKTGVSRPSSVGDSNIYSRTSSKTIVTRPAMRISRYRPGGRRRIYIQRRPPIRTNQRIVPRPQVKPGYRRVIMRKNDDTTRNTVAANRSSTPAFKNVTSAPSTTNIPVKNVNTSRTLLTSTIPPTQATTRVYTAPPAVQQPVTTSSFLKKATRLRNMSIMHAIRRMNKNLDYTDLMKKLDYFMSYYPTVREAATRLTNLLTKHEQTSREERRRIWKGVFRVKSDLRTVNSKCETMHRNVTEVIARVGRQAREFDGYQKTAKKKIDQIEIHQGSQDKQYFEVYERAANNSKEIQRLTNDVALLLPLVGKLFENLERSNMQEKRALEMLDSHARGNIADMTNQILVQQNTLANLGNQVRSEMDVLHEEKQSMAKRMEQHQRRLTETVNSHLSSHVRQINKIEGSLNRQAENIKYISTVVSKHEDMLDATQSVGKGFVEQVTNMSDGLKKMEDNITRFMRDYHRTDSGLNTTQEAVDRLERNTQDLVSSLNDQHLAIGETMERINLTEEVARSVAHDLDAYKEKQGAETDQLRDDLDGILEMQRTHQSNITTLFLKTEIPKGRTMVSQYPSDEPAPESTNVTPRELRTLLTEMGVEDRMSRLTRILHHQQQRMSNVTRAVLRIAEDNEEITMTTSHYFTLINSQAKVIKDQNETIGKLAMIATKQGETIKTLSVELSSGQETVMKLTNILASIASQFKSPMGSQRDCHDVWLNGYRESGVYNVIEDLSLRPVYCNLTKYGGWTVIQRRKDGSQDFDRTMNEYTRGFGDVYGEYWLGLNTILSLTQKVRPRVSLQIIMEDWEGVVRAATYSQFYLYGKSYSMAISGYRGDAGDALARANGLHFTAKKDHNFNTGSSCGDRRRAGWWFSSPQLDCGESSLNGVYRKGATQDARISSTIYWKRWHGVGYPLKSVTMQIIPAEVMTSVYQTEKAPVEINGHHNTESNDFVYQKNILNDNPYRGNRHEVQAARSEPPSYEEDLRQAGISGPSSSQDYDNFDYNRLYKDG